MFRYLLFLVSLLFSLSGFAGEEVPCPETSKETSPAPSTSGESPAAPSTSPQEGATSKEPSTTKDQIGLTLDPHTLIPDKPIVEEKDPERKKILDRIYEAEKREVDAKMRRDEIDRLQKDLEKLRQGVCERDQKLFKEWDNIIEKKKDASIFQSMDALDKETDRILRELDNNWASLESLRKQEQDLHQEWLKKLREETNATMERFSLEDHLHRMDAAQKEASRKDAEKARIPKMIEEDEEF